MLPVERVPSRKAMRRDVVAKMDIRATERLGALECPQG
jgi:hypothetical protein